MAFMSCDLVHYSWLKLRFVYPLQINSEQKLTDKLHNVFLQIGKQLTYLFRSLL